ncbi:Membrane-bound lytic murein transglycosylase B precursor [Roseovarius albus]|uniref:Membrane-bound lytic murein transglycosylase B n=1 Tax=Roseovarius albus TaxID=1247867 RepID=A0A1X6ZJK6_9RHOB|nr:lytic murein transglycosylase [Roseovarius albus]SLN53286.1 Membrane-bound lytic murein transglycosylase B precursor [Roseovarius albus]
MRSFILFSAISGFATVAIAAPVETSLRPKERPSLTLEETFTVASVAPQKVLRPVVRPERLQDGSSDLVIKTGTGNAGFDQWIRGFRGRALAQGISPQVFDRAFKNVRYNTDIIKKDRNQSEFKSQIWDYLDNATSPVRVENGKKALKKHKRSLDRIEKAYGVEKEVVAAVWGMESTYGERRGTIPVVEATATLAYDGRRGAFFEKQLIAALKILQSGDTTPKNMKGSWAGAMGHTQFIPTSYQAYAVDFTGDGRRDIWSDDPSDALASTAAYLKRFGWKKGQPWGVEVRVPKGFSVSRDTKRMPSAWAQKGVVDMQGRPVRDYGSASIYQPAGKAGPSFMTFNNFKVITRYNNSDAYVMGVGHLSDRLAGKPPIQGKWPRGYEPLSFEGRKEVQKRLKRKGYKIEKIDGIIGPNSRKAIVAYQKSVGLKADGYASKQVLESLKKR